jgi:hypothetical protein
VGVSQNSSNFLYGVSGFKSFKIVQTRTKKSAKFHGSVQTLEHHPTTIYDTIFYKVYCFIFLFLFLLSQNILLHEFFKRICLVKLRWKMKMLEAASVSETVDRLMEFRGGFWLCGVLVGTDLLRSINFFSYRCVTLLFKECPRQNLSTF